MPNLHSILPRLWLRRGWVTALLWPLSCVYGVLWRLRWLAYARGWLRSGHPGVPVVVVGNVLVGGAGKTPSTIALVQHLQARGWRVGVVSRGHGRRSTQVCAVGEHSTASEVGDEPLLIQRRTGAWCGWGRRACRLRSACAKRTQRCR